ncbi:MAG: Uncharacterised protein [Halieaceae bacterium]|nr:MAG: Uncharacterised protein [Halieaceae bacterium]
MYARLGPQPTKGILAFKLNGRAFEARHFACGSFDQRRFESLVLAPTQVHTQQHLSPVLRLGASRACLNIEVRVVGVGLTREHATEFELLKLTLKPSQILLYGLRGLFVVFINGEIQQVTGIVTTSIQHFDSRNNGLQRGPLPPQRLGFLGVIPDTGLGQLEFDLFQSILFNSVVKDTP